MAAPYLLSPQALADVDGIADYISKDSPRQARRVIEELFLAMDRLAEMPEIGHWREDLASKRYRFWPIYSYIVVYEPGRKPLWIVRVLGGARLSGLEELQGLLEQKSDYRPSRSSWEFRAVVRYLRYIWALPNTLLGILFGAIGLLLGGEARRVEGTLEFHGPLLAWMLTRGVPIVGGAAAITLGHVVLARDVASLVRCRAHERVHVRQYERWGPFFLPAYFGSSLLARLRGADPYRDNRFEREAYGEEPGDVCS